MDISLAMGLGLDLASPSLDALMLGIFRPGDVGFWPGGFDPARGRIFTDVGSTPATTFGQTIGQATRRAGTLNAVQATSGDRPTLARRPKGGRRNMLNNSRQTGAAVGVVGSGGALPTDMTASASLTQEVLAFDASGFTLKLTGTLSGGYFVNLSGTTIVAAANGQTWVASAFVQAVGAVTGVDAITLVSSSRLAGGALKNAYPSANVGFPATLTRVSTAATTLLDADGAVGAVAFIQPYLRLSCTGAVNITLRIERAQCERGAVATAVQSVATAFDVTETGVPDRLSLVNVSSDSLNLTLPAGNYTVAYVTPSKTVTILKGQSLSGAYSIMRAAEIEDVLIINRDTTANEDAVITAYWQEGIAA